MALDGGDEPEPAGDGSGQIHHATIEPDPDDPLLDLLDVIADVEGCQVEELPPLYEYVDHLVEKLFSTPPPRKAQVQLTFTYYYYRVELDQTGDVTLTRQSEPLDLDA